MSFLKYFATLLLFPLFIPASPAKLVAGPANILVTNDDGWAVAQIRSEFDALAAVDGFNVILSCPASNKSGTGNTTATPTVLTDPCEFDTCPAGSPAVGFNATDPRLNYVNAFPVDAVSFGIQTLAPKFFNGQRPDFVVSGSNVGNNLGPGITGSGTCRAAAQAVMLGVPAVAFSGFTASQISYTTLETDRTSNLTLAALTYDTLTVRLVDLLLKPFTAHGAEILPPGVVININYPPTANCSSVDDFQWIFTRLAPATNATKDVETCGNRGVLTDELTAIQVPGCWITASVYNAVTVKDVDAETQRKVLHKLAPLLSCQ
ncbi:sure-like protein [Macrolepiota fuliginosa MF-IS2]|uniref:Sure-like protein n=1 Tax=Macrolepiota fuliginosa MF-IS2 TaxID=1400762 RepID=A0A9P5WXH3_9AGAR|nr:sure-like protein [Macrolepiota fuliginosa MF-IS2]